MSTARRHHYVQARYLDGFLAPQSDKLWCYGRNRAKPFSAIPDELAHRRDFYRLPDATPEENIESFLERSVENPGLRAIQVLLETRRALDLKGRFQLAKYIAFQEMRVPHAREINRHHTSKSVNHLLEGFNARGGTTATVQHLGLLEGVEVKRDEPFSITREETEAFAKEIANNPETFDLQLMVDLAHDITRFYTTMGWTVLLADRRAAFITSDCPVFRIFEEPGGDDALLRPDCSVCCPLSSRALLILKHDPKFLGTATRESAEGNWRTLPPTSFRRITKAGVENFNLRIAEYSYLRCFSGIQDSGLAAAMQRPSKRTRPDFFAQGRFSGIRWRRTK